MLITTLNIDGQIFHLAPETDSVSLRDRMTAAVLSGAQFVDFATYAKVEVSVLLTPNVPVRFETSEYSEADIATWDPEPASYEVFDLDNLLE